MPSCCLPEVCPESLPVPYRECQARTNSTPACRSLASEVANVCLVRNSSGIISCCAASVRYVLRSFVHDLHVVVLPLARRGMTSRQCIRLISIWDFGSILKGGKC